MFRTLIILGFVLTSSSCTKWKTQKELKHLIHTEIHIPQMEIVQNGIRRDSLANAPADKIKLVIYNSSGGCTACKVSHLKDLDNLFELSSINEMFVPIVIFSPSPDEYGELLRQLAYYPHNYPIYIDKKDAFMQLNRNLPVDTRCHTLLISKTNRVVLVGNPTTNDALWHLFITVLENMCNNDGEYIAPNN